VLRRKPGRAQAGRDTRHANLATLQAHVAPPTQSLPDPPRAHAQGARPKRVARAAKLRRADGVELSVVERPRTRTVPADRQPEAANLAGCSVLTTALPPAPAPKAMGHERSTALASVADALRPCTTGPLAGRPIFLRLAEGTRAPACVGRLAS